MGLVVRPSPPAVIVDMIGAIVDVIVVSINNGRLSNFHNVGAG